MATSNRGAATVASRLLGASVTMLSASSDAGAIMGKCAARNSLVMPRSSGSRGYHSVQLHSPKKHACSLGSFGTARLLVLSTSSAPMNSVYRQQNLQIRQFSVYSAQRLFGSKNSGTQSQVKPRKRFRFLRWTFRLAYSAMLLGIGYVGYTIYLSRSPAEQLEPDPNKKTLVVLGTS